MTLFVGTCIGGPWDGQTLKTNANFVAVPPRTGRFFRGEQKKFPAFMTGDQGIYQFIASSTASPTWRWGANPNA